VGEKRTDVRQLAQVSYLWEADRRIDFRALQDYDPGCKVPEAKA